MKSLQPIIDILTEAGWVADGYVPAKTARVVRHEIIPEFRARFSKGDRRVTIGPKRVSFYRTIMEGKAPFDFDTLSTRNVQAIRERAQRTQ